MAELQEFVSQYPTLFGGVQIAETVKLVSHDCVTDQKQESALRRDEERDCSMQSSEQSTENSDTQKPNSTLENPTKKDVKWLEGKDLRFLESVRMNMGAGPHTLSALVNAYRNHYGCGGKVRSAVVESIGNRFPNGVFINDKWALAQWKEYPSDKFYKYVVVRRGENVKAVAKQAEALRREKFQRRLSDNKPLSNRQSQVWAALDLLGETRENFTYNSLMELLSWDVTPVNRTLVHNATQDWFRSPGNPYARCYAKTIKATDGRTVEFVHNGVSVLPTDQRHKHEGVGAFASTRLVNNTVYRSKAHELLTDERLDSKLFATPVEEGANNVR